MIPHRGYTGPTGHDVRLNIIMSKKINNSSRSINRGIFFVFALNPIVAPAVFEIRLIWTMVTGFLRVAS